MGHRDRQDDDHSRHSWRSDRDADRSTSPSASDDRSRGSAELSFGRSYEPQRGSEPSSFGQAGYGSSGGSTYGAQDYGRGQPSAAGKGAYPSHRQGQEFGRQGDYGQSSGMSRSFGQSSGGQGSQAWAGHPGGASDTNASAYAPGSQIWGQQEQSGGMGSQPRSGGMSRDPRPQPRGGGASSRESHQDSGAIFGQGGAYRLGYGGQSDDQYRSEHADPDYRRWHDEQMASHDRDYHGWRTEQAKRYDDDYGKWQKERQEKFGKDFGDWRSRSTSTPPGGEAASTSSGVQDRGAVGPKGYDPTRTGSGDVPSSTGGVTPDSNGSRSTTGSASLSTGTSTGTSGAASAGSSSIGSTSDVASDTTRQG